VAVIELDLYAPPGGEPGPRRRRPRRYRAAGLVVVLLLTLALGGAAVPVPRMWRPAGSVPITPEGSFQLFDGRLFTFDRSGATLTTTAWRLDPPRRLWSHRSTVPAAEGVPAGFGWFVRPAEGSVVLQAGPVTSVLDAATGRVRWQRRGAVDPVTGPYAVEYDETFAPGGGVDTSDRSGMVFYGSDGLFHDDAPAHTDIRVVDVMTGAVHWQAGFDGGAVATAVPGRPDALLVDSRTGFSLRALATGAVLGARTVAPVPDRDPAFGVPMGGDLLLVTGTDPEAPIPAFGPRVVTAFSQRTLAPVWTRTQSSAGGGELISVCGDLPCLIRPDSVTALDPATGRDRWSIDMNASLRRYGPDVYVVENTQTRVLEVRDPVTGALRADLRAWPGTSIPVGTAPIILNRPESGGVVFALLRPYGRVQVLGRSAEPVTECQNNAAVAVCRTPAGAVAWTYHA
jgi:outer membrane protein assembly factor BamB